MRGETLVGRHFRVLRSISIHSPRAGRDSGCSTCFNRVAYFNPLAPCGARPNAVLGCSNPSLISIHSPRAGRDHPDRRDNSNLSNFNPLAPCGARPQHFHVRKFRFRFQSTRPVRGETELLCVGLACCLNFNPLAPCGARLAIIRERGDVSKISIHSPRAGRDQRFTVLPRTIDLFQSTRPVRGETRRSTAGTRRVSAFQSTRPVRGETRFHRQDAVFCLYFNPLAPCGARPASPAYRWTSWNFNPLAPCGARQQKCTSYITLVCTLLIKRTI